MTDGKYAPTFEAIRARVASRVRPDGTVLALPDATDSAVEATAWWALLERLGTPPSASPSSEALVRLQLPDGRLSASPLHPGAFGPTAIAILAWNRRAAFDEPRRRASDFLLSERGDHFPRSPESPLGMNTDLAGWPWISRTFSWAEPTALALLALEAEGLGDHPRAEEGRRLLLDRQIASGGWNYGNARVFGTDLRPTQESTGLVLAALAGRTPRAEVELSLRYLADVGPGLRSPLALGWTLLAWSAWHGATAPFAAPALAETLERESRYGAYESAELALLAAAVRSPLGLIAAFRETA